MFRTSTRSILTLAFVLVAAASLAALEAKHTGTVVAVEPNHQRIAIEEMGPWSGRSRAS